MEIDAYSNINSSNISTTSQNTSSFNTNNANASLFDKLIASNSDIENIDAKASANQGLASFSQDLAILNETAKEAVKSFKDDSEQSSDSSNTHDELSLILELRRLQAS